MRIKMMNKCLTDIQWKKSSLIKLFVVLIRTEVSNVHKLYIFRGFVKRTASVIAQLAMPGLSLVLSKPLEPVVLLTREVFISLSFSVASRKQGLR